jgi:hypothetical protein
VQYAVGHLDADLSLGAAVNFLDLATVVAALSCTSGTSKGTHLQLLAEQLNTKNIALYEAYRSLAISSSSSRRSCSSNALSSAANRSFLGGSPFSSIRRSGGPSIACCAGAASSLACNQKALSRALITPSRSTTPSGKDSMCCHMCSEFAWKSVETHLIATDTKSFLKSLNFYFLALCESMCVIPLLQAFYLLFI